MTRHLAILLAAFSSFAPAQDQPPAPAPAPPATQNQPPDPAPPPIEKLDDSRYRIGTLTLNQKTREIRFPTKVNMAEGLLEYILCMQKGKVHEALLVTDISPTHLNLAFTLLRYPASDELFSLPDKTGRLTNKFPSVPATVKSAARIAIDVEWNDPADKTRRLHINEWIENNVKKTTMLAGPWLYTGGRFNEGKYVPEMTGDIAAIMVVPEAIINYPGSDNGDNVWFALRKHVPPVGTPVTVIITPYSNSNPVPKP